MSQRPVYTSFNIPTVITHPSARCLQWSDDGQLCLVTKSAVHILVSISVIYRRCRLKCAQTPDHGINFSTPADVKSPIPDEGDRPLGWYRTMIETARTQTHSWPSLNQGCTLQSSLSSHSSASRLGIPYFGFLGCLCSCCNMFTERLVVSWKVRTPPFSRFISFMLERCIIAVLNSNMEVSLWAAGKNHLKGEWLNVGSFCHLETL